MYNVLLLATVSLVIIIWHNMIPCIAADDGLLMQVNLRLQRNSDMPKRRRQVVNGQNATLGRFPYFTAISLQIPFVNDIRICGGSLIAPDVVLTAAHCWQGPAGKFDVQVGVFDILNPMKDIFLVTHYIPHPRSGIASYFDDDIMILILNDTSSSKTVQVNRNESLPQNRQELVTMGLGSLAPRLDAPYPITLQQLTTTTFPNNECQRSTDGRISYQGYITDNMLCASTPTNAGPCYTDSGGPLILPGFEATDDVLVGIVSWGVGCGNPVLPDVYTRISGLTDWIDANVCRYSQKPPVDFHCHERTFSPAPTPLVLSTKNDINHSNTTTTAPRSIPITVQINLGSLSTVTWWFILNNFGELVFLKPQYSYADNQTFDQRVLYLLVGRNYTFVMKNNDDLCTGGGVARYIVRLGLRGNGAIVAHGGGEGASDCEERMTFAILDSFTVGPASPTVDTFSPSEALTIQPTVSPTITFKPTQTSPSATPSLSHEPTVTASPTIETHNVTIVIHFAGYPTEVGYNILDEQNKRILHVPIGTFGVLQVTDQRVVSLATFQTYTFEILDYFGDGFWPGNYSIYFGSPLHLGSNILLSGIGIKSFGERIRFFVNASSISGAASPSLHHIHSYRKSNHKHGNNRDKKGGLLLSKKNGKGDGKSGKRMV